VFASPGRWVGAPPQRPFAISRTVHRPVLYVGHLERLRGCPFEPSAEHRLADSVRRFAYMTTYDWITSLVSVLSTSLDDIAAFGAITARLIAPS
jgi:hypothetical protein